MQHDRRNVTRTRWCTSDTLARSQFENTSLSLWVHSGVSSSWKLPPAKQIQYCRVHKKTTTTRNTKHKTKNNNKKHKHTKHKKQQQETQNTKHNDKKHKTRKHKNNNKTKVGWLDIGGNEWIGNGQYLLQYRQLLPHTNEQHT